MPQPASRILCLNLNFMVISYLVKRRIENAIALPANAIAIGSDYGFLNRGGVAALLGAGKVSECLAEQESSEPAGLWTP